MAKVANRVQGKRSSSHVKSVPTNRTRTGRVLTTKITVDTGFKGLRDLNRQALISLKH